jgi:hypothetical protein
MNRDWMRERLESFLELCEAYDKEYVQTPDYSDALRAINDRMTFQMPTIREILKRLDPALAPDVKEPQHLGGVSDSRKAVQQGLDH